MAAAGKHCSLGLSISVEWLPEARLPVGPRSRGRYSVSAILGGIRLTRE